MSRTLPKLELEYFEFIKTLQTDPRLDKDYRLNFEEYANDMRDIINANLPKFYPDYIRIMNERHMYFEFIHNKYRELYIEGQFIRYNVLNTLLHIPHAAAHFLHGVEVGKKLR